MDISALRWEPSTIASYTSLLFSFGIIGMRLQIATAKRRCALAGVTYNYNITMPLRSHRTQHIRSRPTNLHQILTFGDARRQITTTKKFSKRTKPPPRMGRLSPEEFEVFFINNYLVSKKTTRDLNKLPEPDDDKKTTTSNRELHYYEPYWINGAWMLYTPIPDERVSMQWKWQIIQGLKATTPPTVKDGAVSWKIYRHCFPICLTIYKDFGPVCGTHLVELGQYWATQYKDFDNYCQLQYFNCAYYDYGYKVAHRGKCPEKYHHYEMDLTKYWAHHQHWVVPEGWKFDENNLYLGYPLDFGRNLGVKKWNLATFDPTFQTEGAFRLGYNWGYSIWQYRGMFG